MRSLPDPARRHRYQAWAAGWLLLGAVLLLLTPLPAHTVALGWAPAFWLLGAPACLGLVLEPRTPLRWAAWLVRGGRRRGT